MRAKGAGVAALELLIHAFNAFIEIPLTLYKRQHSCLSFLICVLFYKNLGSSIITIDTFHYIVKIVCRYLYLLM